MEKIVIIISVVSFILLLSRVCFAQNKILINEFLIEPAPQTVEIINASSQSADISNWYIDDSGGSIYYTLPQDVVISPNSCLIFSYDFNLNKSSPDMIRFFDNTAPPTSPNAKIIDSFSYKTSPGSGISFLRLPDGENNWTTGSANLGFFNLTGQSCLITITPTTIPALSPTVNNISFPSPTLTPEPIITINNSYNNIFLSEAMTYPETGSNEWVELYNSNDFSVNLINWYLDDIENAGSSPKTFSLEIAAKSYQAIDLTSSMFNNDGDNIRLLDSNKNLKDGFEYNNIIQGKTLGRINFDSDSFCLQEPSKETVNNNCLNPTLTIVPTLSKTPAPSLTKIEQSDLIPSKNDLLIKNQLTKIGQITKKSKTEQNNVLGWNTQAISAKPFFYKILVRSLSLTSLSYSVLTLLSLLIKIKNAV